MITLYKPAITDLWFREKLMGDEATMSYNRAWGGTIPFPESRWAEWYDRWVADCGSERFYRYLVNSATDEFVGEIAYHDDDGRCLANVIVPAEHRGRGYGTRGLELLCAAAADHGVEILYDDIALDNPAVRMFLKNGFTEDFRTDEIIMLKKRLR